MLEADDIAKGIGEMLLHQQGDPPISGFPRAVVDSRQVEPGDLFVALRGQRQDGHDFILDAAERGAAGVMVEKGLPDYPRGVAAFQVTDCLEALQRLAAYKRSSQTLRVIGITGSVGKTTCKELTAAVLSQRYVTLKSEGNLNTEIGLPLTLLELTERHQAAVLEMGMLAPGDIALLCRIAQPQVGLITNIGPVHLERLGSLEAIASAKAEIIEALPAPEGTAVLNGDDPMVCQLATRTQARVVFYGSGKDCQVRGSHLRSYGLDGFSFRITYGGQSQEVKMSLPGKHNLHNALAAAAVALLEGISLEEIVEALSRARMQNRLRLLAGPAGSRILDDSYNASPASMLAALDLLAETRGRKLALLGDMRELGAAEEEGHRRVGQWAARTTDVLLVIGEKAELIAEAARQSGHADVRVLPDKKAAAEMLKRDLRMGDYLLVKASRAMALETVVEALGG
ncbi:MAG TPA: UDP-N-acetylmuramoyl-tripeptide--D-alanyl-D-alanine ligase [Dehalococcoidia bacterium]|nr:UDP-N-acetylmuramoyl-tripeptide--D-alanyl-D-alanine ligase [Dehalococcoidia bacterium]